MRPLSLTAVFMAIAAVASAGSFELSPALTGAEFETLTGAVADAISFPLMGPAEPEGVLGLQIMPLAGGVKVDDRASWWRHAVAGDASAGVLPAARVMARKGLPAGVDIGGQYGKVLGESFWGAEARWALVAGSSLLPAVGVRASYSKLDADALDVDSSEIQLAVSKGVALLTPYAAVGYRRASASAVFGTVAQRHQVDEETVTATAGVRISLLPLRLVVEARRAARTSFFVGLGVGL